MALYAIADLHLSLGENKPMDIFKGWNNYVEKLKYNWEKTISEDDTIVIAGDISWALKLHETKSDFEFINKLPGKKVFIKGNHDYWWSTRKKVEDYLSLNNFNSISILYNSAYITENIAICGTRGWTYDCESSEDEKILNREVGRLQTSIQAAKNCCDETIVFLHYPPVYSGYECKEIIDVLIKNNIKKCYYGHLHGNAAKNNAVTGIYKGINFNFISADLINFSPLLICK